MKQAVNKKLEEAKLQGFCQYWGCWGCVRKKHADIGLCKDHVSGTPSSSAAGEQNTVPAFSWEPSATPGPPDDAPTFLQRLKAMALQMQTLIDDVERSEI